MLFQPWLLGLEIFPLAKNLNFLHPQAYLLNCFFERTFFPSCQAAETQISVVRTKQNLLLLPLPALYKMQHCQMKSRHIRLDVITDTSCFFLCTTSSAISFRKVSLFKDIYLCNMRQYLLTLIALTHETQKTCEERYHQRPSGQIL